jgi:hypothetical protein
LIDFSQQYLTPGATSRRKLSVQITAGSKPFTMPYQNNASVTVIDNLPLFKQHSQLYLFKANVLKIAAGEYMKISR